MISPEISIYTAVLLVGASQGVFLALALLILPKSLKRANLYLAGFVFAYTLELFFRFLIETKYLILMPTTVTLNWALDTVYGPLIYFYVKAIRNESNENGKFASPHTMIPAFSLAIAISLWLFYDESDFIASITGEANSSLILYQWSFALVGLASMTSYLLSCIFLLNRHKKQIPNTFSYTDKISLDWLRYLISVLTTLLILYTLFILLDFQSLGMEQIYPIAMVLVVFVIGFIGIRQPVVFVQHEEQRAPDSLPKATKHQPPIKYKKSALSSNEVNSLYIDIKRRVDKEELYRQNNLSLPKLAEQLELPSHYVSQAINQCSGTNFFDFINKRRVRFITDRLNSSNSARMNILELAMDAGFNSKSSFYSGFKNYTGMTPKQYQKSN